MPTEQELLPGIARWQEITDTLNSIAKTRGITKDNKRIWSYLHKWTNEDWAEMIVAAKELIRQYPEYATRDQRNKINRAAATLKEDWDIHPRILDTPEYKSQAWAALMSLRELMNQSLNEQIMDSTAAMHKRTKELFYEKEITN